VQNDGEGVVDERKELLNERKKVRNDRKRSNLKGERAK